MKREKTMDLTKGAVGKVLLAFILPILAGSLIQQLYTVVDAVVVGRYAGKEGLAAIDSVYTLFKFPLNFMSGLSAGATIVVSKLFGAGDERKLGSSIRAAFAISVVLGAVFSLLGALAAPLLKLNREGMCFGRLLHHKRSAKQGTAASSAGAAISSAGTVSSSSGTAISSTAAGTGSVPGVCSKELSGTPSGSLTGKGVTLYIGTGGDMRSAPR